MLGSLGLGGNKCQALFSLGPQEPVKSGQHHSLTSMQYVSLGPRRPDTELFSSPTVIFSLVEQVLFWKLLPCRGNESVWEAGVKGKMHIIGRNQRMGVRGDGRFRVERRGPRPRHPLALSGEHGPSLAAKGFFTGISSQANFCLWTCSLERTGRQKRS